MQLYGQQTMTGNWSVTFTYEYFLFVLVCYCCKSTFVYKILLFVLLTYVQVYRKDEKDEEREEKIKGKNLNGWMQNEAL